MEKTKVKGFIWYGLRIGFSAFIICWTLSAVIGVAILPKESNSTTFIFSMLAFLFSIFCFVLSIIHLTNYKEKALAIVALILSSYWIMLIFALLMIGI